MGRDKSLLDKLRKKRKNRRRLIYNPFKSAGIVLKKPWARPYKRFLKNQKRRQASSELQEKWNENEFNPSTCATSDLMAAELYRGSSCWPDTGVTPNEMPKR
nr:uncharacterized protein LOC108119687 [Drosophila bipectinata]